MKYAKDGGHFTDNDIYPKVKAINRRQDTEHILLFNVYKQMKQ